MIIKLASLKVNLPFRFDCMLYTFVYVCTTGLLIYSLVGFKAKIKKKFFYTQLFASFSIPQTNSYIIRMNREDNLCWFHGKVSRENAEQILREGKVT